MERFKLTVGFVLIIAVVLAAIGQYYLSAETESFHEGLIFLSLAVGLLIFLEWQTEESRKGPSTGTGEEVDWTLRLEIKEILQHYGRNLALTGLSVGAILLALLALRGDPSNPELAFFWWCLSALSLIAGWTDLSRIRWRLEWGRTEIVLLGGIILIGGVLRLFDLASIPQNLGGDEASQGLAAIDFITGDNRDMFTVGWYGVPTMSFFWQSLWFRLLGVSIFSLRLPWALIGTATIVLFFWLLRPLFGTKLALLASFLLATYHYHIHFSRLGSNQVADPFFLLLALGLLLRGIETRHRVYFVLTGAIMGASLYFYAGARLAPIWLGATAGLWILFRPGFWQKHRSGLILVFVAFVIMGGPMLLLAVEHPDTFNARFNQVNIFRSGWLEGEISQSGRSMLDVLIDQTRRAVYSFNYFPDRTVWYGAREPFLNFAGAVLFILGMGYAIAQGVDLRLLPFVLWFWLAVILGAALNESPPSSMRLITLAPSLCFFPVLALTKLADLSGMLWQKRRNLIVVGQIVIVGWLATSSVWFYFMEHTPKRIYGSTNAEVATVAGRYLHDLSTELGDDFKVYFFGLPRMYFGFATIPFLAPEVEGIDAPESLQGPPSFVDESEPAVFIFLPERREDLQKVREYYPDGQLREFRQDVEHQTLFWAYIVEGLG